jgi:hypothetical protein
MQRFSPRIHVLLAREAPLGVIIRRGPSKAVCTILWNRQRDEFQLGQWFKGRIYERRSDLSPDGKHLIYFAMNGKWTSEARGAWTAISRAPYLKAIAMFPKGDCWHGGGLFTGKDTYWLNDGYGHTILHNTSEVRRDLRFQPSEYFGGECTGVYYVRLIRDGWKLVERVKTAQWKECDVFEKQLPGGWILRKVAHAEVGAPAGKGCYWDEHELLHRQSEAFIKCADWEWADLDGERLVWTVGGRLCMGRLQGNALADEEEIADFNEMTFQPIIAPY